MVSKTKSGGKWVVLFGDQLDLDAAIWRDFDKQKDTVWMAEAVGESTHVWSSKPRIAVFLAAMRHFREALRTRGIHVHYRELSKSADPDILKLLKADIEQFKPESIRFIRPGEWRILEGLKQVLEETQVDWEMWEDDHFFTTPRDFAEYADGRKQLRMEYFYREQRKRFGILMEDDKPVGGQWNYDADNRGAFGKSGPVDYNKGPNEKPDELTREVLEMVESQFPDHPGSLNQFSWPVTAESANALLDRFIEERLPYFGDYQDAMWQNEPWLYHSWISAAMNLKLLNPRVVCEKAEASWRDKRAPLNAVEGFIRQILGWREYVRGIYWHFMPDYAESNALEAEAELPEFYWTGDTEYACLRACIAQTLDHGYAHHIQRLMVTGLYALLLGVKPKAIHEWYLAVYVDAVEWVELPNVIGMSQFADGGIMASKPYAATGKYIQRMSNYCESCPKNPAKRTGPEACPFTTLYWDFLLRNQTRLQNNQRMTMQLRNLQRLSKDEVGAIQEAASALKKRS